MKKVMVFALLVLGCMSCSKSAPEKLSGAGATFPAPFYNIVFKQYSQTGGAEVTYGAVGSGGGIRSLKDKTVDFGASDVFLSDTEMSEMGADVIHVPTALGAVVLAYNLKEIKGLRLTADLIADIYLGKITKWDDARITAINPSLRLPSKAITAVYRSDGSGTTYVFSDYMSKVNPTWKEQIGTGKSLKFPTGVAAKGNPGVAGIIAEVEGAIGYIGSEYALAIAMPAALLQNSAGNFIEANTKSISASANVDMPADTRIMITNTPNPEGYPISTFTWIIVYKEQNYNKRIEARGKSLLNLLNYIISEDGQAVAAKTHYAPLSASALEKTKAALKSITYNGVALEE